MSQVPSTCIKCGLDTPILSSCINCSLAYHPSCGMYALKQNDEDIHICSSCITIPEVRTKYSLPPILSRSNSNSSLSSVKRKKDDLELLHQQALSASDGTDSNNNNDGTSISAQQLNEYSTRQDLISALSSPAPTMPGAITTTQQYLPKPLLKVKDDKNFNIQELHEVFTSNFNSLREDYLHLNNIQKIHHQNSVNFYNVIKGQGVIIDRYEKPPYVQQVLLG